MTRKLGVAVVGLGMAAKPHALALKALSDDIEVIGTFARSAETRQSFFDTHGFAPAKSLKLLAENEDIHKKVADSFSDIEASQSSRLLITYTCDLRPSVPEQEGLAKYELNQ